MLLYAYDLMVLTAVLGVTNQEQCMASFGINCSPAAMTRAVRFVYNIIIDKCSVNCLLFNPYFSDPVYCQGAFGTATPCTVGKDPKGQGCWTFDNGRTCTYYPHKPLKCTDQFNGYIPTDYHNPDGATYQQVIGCAY